MGLQANLYDIRCPSHVCAVDLSKAVYQPNNTRDDRAIPKSIYDQISMEGISYSMPVEKMARTPILRRRGKCKCRMTDAGRYMRNKSNARFRGP